MKNQRLTIVFGLILMGFIILMSYATAKLDKKFDSQKYKETVKWGKHLESIEGKPYTITIDNKKHEVTVDRGDVAE